MRQGVFPRWFSSRQRRATQRKSLLRRRLTIENLEQRTLLAVAGPLEGDQAVMLASPAGHEAAAAAATLEPLVQKAKLIASDGAANNAFGQGVAISGDTLVVGAGNGNAAYVFAKPASGWADMVQIAKLTASDDQPGSYFGVSVAISGDTIVVGAMGTMVGTNAMQGAAYVFAKPISGWTDMTQTAKLTSAGGRANDRTGFSVGISGDTVVVGSKGANSMHGAAFVFECPAAGWSDMNQTATLTSSDDTDLLGLSVAIDGPTIVAGARSTQGSAYLFAKPGDHWTDMTQTATLALSDDTTMADSAAIDGDTVVLATLSDKGAYVFVRPAAGWANTTETAKLTASNADPITAATISGDRILAGSGQIKVGDNSYQGAVYEFDKPTTGWVSATETAKLLAADGQASDQFGYAVAANGSTAVVGALGVDVGASTGQGAAYVFQPGTIAQFVDFVASAVTAPTTAAGGSSITVNWHVTNAGMQNAAGSWRDSVYLSSTPAIGPQSICMGSVEHSGGLAAGAAYEGSLTAALPGVTSGSYYVLVKAESASQFPDPDRANNMAAATTGPLQIIVPVLELGTFFSDAIPAAGEGRYYQLTLPGTARLTLRLDDADNQGANELYARFGTPPTRQLYDYRQPNVPAADQQVVVPAADAGTWYVWVYGTSVTGDYTIRADAEPLPELVPGTPRADSFTTLDRSRYYQVTVPAGQNLLLTLDDADNVGTNELYARFGAPPTRGLYDHRAEGVSGPDQRIFIPGATGGTWYVLAYAASGGGEYTIRADTAALDLRDVTPRRYAAGAPLELMLSGGGFTNPLAVELVSADGTSYAAASVQIDSFAQVSARFAAGAVPPGTYTVRVARPGIDSDTLPQAVQIVAGGSLAHLKANFYLPSDLGRTTPATLYVDYANTGDIAMPAPMLILASGDPDGSDRPLLSLDGSRMVNGLWTSGSPIGLGNSVQFLASGATPGVLQPGESVRVPVYYAGLQQPWDLNDDQIEFEMGAVTADDTTPIDWAAVKAGMRPSYVPADAWDVLWANFTSQVGSTWGRYVATLDDNAVYLSRLGQRVDDITYLQALEFREADGLNPIRALAAAVDASATAPGLPIVFERYFAQPISHRYELGPLGRGWKHNWQYSLSVGGDGTVTITDMGGTPRIFQPDRRPGFPYLPAAGDNGVLSKLPDGSFQLRETDGSISAYRADGKLDYVEDTNGNRITCGYTGNLLTSLTHSAGQVVSIAYNAAARIASVTDPDGRQTLFTYDATNEHLISVQAYDGRATGYSYNPGHAITETALPDGTHQYYTYDAKGRLASVSRDGGAEQVAFSYDTTGRVSATDALGATSRYYIDHWARLAKTENALGNAVLKRFDAVGNLTAVTDPAGGSSTYAYDARRNLVRATDAMGHTTRFTYTSDSSRAASMTDANGNPTNYGYDAKGNLASITYADGSRETWTYFGNGEVKSWTNRRGNDTPGDPNDGVVGFTYDADGRLTGKSFADGSQVDYVYDARGNLVETVDSQGTTHYIHDANDAVQRIDYPGGQWLEFAYDAAGRRASSLDQLGHRLDYHYDAVGRLESIVDETSAAIVAYQYDPRGQLVRKTVGNGLYTTYEYDLAGQLLHLVNHAADGPAISRFDYTYDLRGRRTTMNTLDGLWNYTYDAVGQLTHAVFAPATGSLVPAQDLAYTYDAMGNRVRTVENGVTTEYTTNHLNQYTGVGDTTYTFDKDGNLIQETSPRGTVSYSYDDENRLIAVGKGADSWRYTYDALGERVATNVNGIESRFIIDPVGLGNLVGEYNGSGNLVARYDYGLGLISRTTGGSIGYYLFDAIGSTQQLVTSVGTVANRYHYDPYGRAILADQAIANPFQFVGERGVMADTSGHDYMRARYYASGTGRFISMDPLGTAADSNVYRYAYNSPAIFVDPAGTDCYLKKPGNWGGVTVPGCLVVNTGRDDWAEILADRVHEEVHRAGIKDEYYAYMAGAEVARLLHRPELVKFFEDSANKRIPYKPDPEADAEIAWAHLECRDSLKPMPPLLPKMKQIIKKWVNRAKSKDPNEKTGPAGVGAGSYVTPDQPFSYRVDYENEASATAPAQVVTVTDNLDPDLDWNSFELTEVGFGDRLIAVPAGLRHFETAVPMTYGGLEFEVRIELGIRLETGEVYANFYSVDPATGLPPPVEIGFLPPEDGTGRGMGHFGYVIRPKTGLASGTEIRNVARIQFDYAEIIATNQVDPHDPSQGTDSAKECLNTIDAGVPASSVLALGAVTRTASFPVQWAGQDETGGSGVAKYDIYVSDNGGAYSLWLDDTAQTTATFTGQFGHRYGFYSVASDQVGHQEAAPAAAATETLLSPPAGDTIGVYVPDNSAFYLHDRQDGGDAEHVFVYGVAGVGWMELMGDWNGDGQDTPGFYDPATGMWYLSNKLEPGDAEYMFMFGIAGQGWKPLVGDWDTDGKDSIAIYEPATSLFFFKNTLAGGDADEAVQFGVGSLGWIPIAGDWDGIASNGDGFGFYEPAISAFWLKNARTSGPAEECFQFGMGSLGWTVLSGNWDGLPGDGVGFYIPETGQWFLKNEHAPGPAEVSFVFGIGGAGWRPLVGCWQADAAAPAAIGRPSQAASASPLPSAIDQLDLAALAAAQLQPEVDHGELDRLIDGLPGGRRRGGGRR